MATPISTSLVPAGLQDTLLAAIELRAQSNLLLTLLGTNQAADELRVLRNDQAFALGLTPPAFPGN